ncbi:MAG: flippase-like domain-containing protein [Candidatus Aminicenantes bacterium]|nr:flippase-like domain-containing protein [Candidatus Aminicenantes bacterium]
MKKNNKNKWNWLKIVIGFVVTVLALWLSFKNLDWRVLKEALLRINLIWVGLAVLNAVFTVYALGFRWRILLASKKSVSLGYIFRLNILNQYANILVPARLGEVIRIYLIRRGAGIPVAYAAGTVLIEKMMDTFAFVTLWIAVPAVLALQEKVRGYKIAVFVCGAMAVLLLVLIWRPAVFLRLIRFASRILPHKFRDRIVGFFEEGFKAFHMLKDVKILIFLILLTFVLVMLEVLTNFMLFQAFDFPLPFVAALFLLLGVQVGVILPSTPGKVGVLELAVIYSLSVFSIPKSEALSFALVFHIIVFLPKILLGLYFISRLDISLKKNYFLEKNEKP